MSKPIDDHTLNACLARAIGVKLQPHPNRKLSPRYYWIYSGGLWDPLHDANQMEEVEAGILKKHGHITYRLYDDKAYCRINNWAWYEGTDKKRAFALAVQAMEQSNNNNNKED